MALPFSFRPPVIAHRGASALAPENTMAAFRLAREQGAVWIETDVKLTRDGVPILMHDDTLDRTTDGKGPVAAQDWADIKKLDAGSWFDPAFTGERVPHLADFLRFALDHNLRINLEIKPCPGRARSTAMVTLIETSKIWPADVLPPLISSFDVEALTIAAQLHPEWPRGLLLEEWDENWQDVMAKTQASLIHLGSDALTQERIALLHKAGIPVLAHTVNSLPRAQELLQQGADGVFWDNPSEIIKTL
ncbi:MAG: glycerophosphodiester phosphodiesterase [Alphaproteobacteria bacterium]|nr:glycerophosphodiester phosphodiesterase [Alphaproteobacteria bacterium]